MLVWYDTCEKYIGQWREDLQNGYGVHIWYESKGEQKYLRSRYVGEWCNGKRCGYGVFFYSNGGRYEGMWQDDYKDGFGVFTFQNGSQYIGKFQNDRMIEVPTDEILTIKNGKLNDVIKNNQIKSGSNIGTTAGNRNKNETVKDTTKTSNSNENQIKKVMEKGVTINTPTGGEPKPDEKLQTGSTITNYDKVEKPEKAFAGKKNSDLDVVKEIENETASPLKVKEGGKDEGKDIKKNKDLSNKDAKNVPKVSKDSTDTKKDQKDGVNKDNKENDVGKEPAKDPKDKDSKDPKDNKDAKDPKSKPNKDPKGPASVASQVNNNQDSKDDQPQEENPFNKLLDLSDILEIDPDIENSLKEIKNILLRYLTDMKLWYKVYANKEYYGEAIDIKEVKEKNSNITLSEDILKENGGDFININADIGFAMEMKDLWRFLRDCNILSADFTIANFNRLYYKGPKNYMELFMCPDEVDIKGYYDYLYTMIQKSKEDFIFKYPQSKKLGQPDYGNIENINENDINMDIHNRKNLVLLRNFYEAIVRAAFLKFFRESDPLDKGLKKLFDGFIKKNQNLKKLLPSKKSQQINDSSLNTISFVVMDMKLKTFDKDFDDFLEKYELSLKEIFRSLYFKSTVNPKKNDITLTYGFIFENLIKKSEHFKKIDKIKFIEYAIIYHNPKPVITEENCNTRDNFMIIENLFESEVIFLEFCELFFLIIRRCILDNNENTEIRERNKDKEKDHIQEKMYISHIRELSTSIEFIFVMSDKYKIYYPKLDHHYAYEKILENERQRKEEEEKRILRLLRLEKERKMMENDDHNVAPENYSQGKRDEEDDEDD